MSPLSAWTCGSSDGQAAQKTLLPIRVEEKREPASDIDTQRRTV